MAALAAEAEARGRRRRRDLRATRAGGESVGGDGDARDGAKGQRENRLTETELWLLFRLVVDVTDDDVVVEGDSSNAEEDWVGLVRAGTAPLVPLAPVRLRIIWSSNLGYKPLLA